MPASCAGSGAGKSCGEPCWTPMSCGAARPLIVAGLMAEGASVVRDEGFLERGYEHIVEDLRGAGAALTCRRSLPTAAK